MGTKEVKKVEETKKTEKKKPKYKIVWSKLIFTAIVKAGMLAAAAFFTTLLLPTLAPLAVIYGVTGGIWAVFMAHGVYKGTRINGSYANLGKTESFLASTLYDNYLRAKKLVLSLKKKFSKEELKQGTVEKADEKLQEELKEELKDKKEVQPVKKQTLFEKMAMFLNLKKDKNMEDDFTKK